MKQYTKLQIPSNTAWERRTWRRYVHWRIKEFIDGFTNVIRWIPTAYRDRHWDDYYITKILQKKIEFQREYLVKHNRHMSIPIDNRDMTWVLNLIERKHEDYYSTERRDYIDSTLSTVAVENEPSLHRIEETIHSENLDEYFKKYKGAVRRVKKLHPDKDFSDKKSLAFYLSLYNQKRCNKLIWKIMEERSEGWWD